MGEGPPSTTTGAVRLRGSGRGMVQREGGDGEGSSLASLFSPNSFPTGRLQLAKPHWRLKN